MILKDCCLRKAGEFVLLFLFFACSVSALVVSPSAFDVRCYLGQTCHFSFNVSNNLNFTAWNVSFGNVSDDFFVSPVTTINPGETVVTDGRLSCSNTYGVSWVVPVGFLFWANVSRDGVSYGVNVSSGGFSVPELQLIDGDSVVFSSVDVDNHTIIETSLGINQVLASNSSFDVRLGVGNFSFIDLPSHSVLNVRVDPTGVQLVHDSAYDVLVVINAVCTVVPANVSFEVFIRDFNLSENEIGRGVLRVSNVGSSWAYNLSVNGSWVSVDSVSGDLAPFSSLLSFFNVTPNVSGSENGSFVKPICLSGGNFDPACIDLNVFVRSLEGNVSAGGGGITFVYVFNESLVEGFCKQYPERCPSTNVTLEKVVERNLHPEVNESSVYDLLRAYIELRDAIQRMENRQNLLSEDTKATISDFDVRLNNVSGSVDSIRGAVESIVAEAINRSDVEAVRSRRVERSVSFIAAFLIFLLVVGVFLTFTFVFLRNKSVSDFKMMRR